MSGDVRSLGTPGHHFSNWATTYSCQPELYFEPQTTEEIRQILSFAREKGKKVKVIGYGHSPSDLACTTDYMISLNKYNKVLNIDTDRLQVTVQGGCVIKHLNEEVLPKHNMALSVQGTVSELTVAGCVSTGTHGTGANFGILSSYVVSLQMMTASGEIIEISPSKNAELFPAATLSLGCLGVILTLTIQCEAAYNLHQKQYGAKLDQVLENLNVYVTSSEHFRFFWFPYTDSVTCFHSTRTREEPRVKSSWFWSMAVGYYLLQILYWISTFISSLAPVINRFYYHFLYSAPTEVIDRSDRVFNFNCLFKQYVMEWSIPREKTALVLFDLKNWIQQNRFPAHFPIEVRFVKGDNIFLSPSYGRDTCYINIIMYRPFNKLVRHNKYWNAFQDIMKKAGGRPHWAKDHKLGREDFLQLYPNFEAFCKIRESLDPNGMFLNANLERVFGKSPSFMKTV